MATRLLVKYREVGAYGILYRVLCQVVSIPKSQNIYRAKLYNNAMRILHGRTIVEPADNRQHSWVNEKSILSKIRGNIVLDCGCGRGRWGYLLKTKEVIGVDVLSEYLKKAKQLHCYEGLVKANLTNLPFKEKTFDTVLAVEVIEHLTSNDGVKFLKELKRIGKYLVLTTPKVFVPINFGEGSPENHLSFWTSNDIKKCIVERT
jgi:ubiquinone/menaquinone biosynthesis C-methylase UbiE